MCFLTVLEAANPRGVGRVHAFWRPWGRNHAMPLSSFWWLPATLGITCLWRHMPFYIHVPVFTCCSCCGSCVSVFSSCKDINYWIKAHLHPVWPQFNYICKDPVPKDSHILRGQVAMNLEEVDTIQPCIRRKFSAWPLTLIPLLISFSRIFPVWDSYPLHSVKLCGGPRIE